MAGGDTTFPLHRAELVALFLESLVFGAFTVLYFIAIWILLYRGRHGRRSALNKSLFATSTIMWLLSVAHIGLDVQRALEAFVDLAGVPDGALTYYGQLNKSTHVIKSVIFITMTLFGDSFVTYRVWIVWNRQLWIAVLPAMLVIGTAVAGYGACYQFTQAGDGAVVFESNIVPWITSFFSLSLTTNLISTLLITGRIVWSHRKVRKYRASTSSLQWDIIETLVQSAAIYSFALTCLLATYVAGSNAQYVCLDTLQPLMGVVFTLIIIRVGLGYTLSDSSAGEASERQARSSQLHSGHEYPLRPVAINVSVSQTRDRPSLEFDSKTAVGDLEAGTRRK